MCWPNSPGIMRRRRQIPSASPSSARNRFVGLVTKVTIDQVMAEVQMQCGPFTVVSLMSSESATELGLEPGVVAVAVVKATTVIVETTWRNLVKSIVWPSPWPH